MAQKFYEKGYVVDNDGRKQNVLVFVGRDYFKDNPTKVIYRESENGDPITASIDEISEFGVGDTYVFRRFNTLIDYSSQNPHNMSRSMQPEYKSKTVFLDLLIEGEASIYQYREGKVDKFFLQMGGDPIPLVNKKFVKPGASRAYGNFAYKQQLIDRLVCRSLHRSTIEKKKYKDTHLVFLAEEYNKCKGTSYTNNLAVRNEHDYYNLWIKGGIADYSLEFEDVLGPADEDFGSVSTYYVGFENELMLPYGRGNWSLVAGANYLSVGYGSEEGILGNNYVEHKTIEINAGIRRYFPITNGIAIFLSAQYLNDFANDSYFSVNGKDGSGMELSPNNTYSLSGGIRWKRLYGEYRYVAERSLSENWPKYNSYFEGSSIAIGINVF